MEPVDRSDTTAGQVEQPATPPQNTHALLHGLYSPDATTADILLSVAAGARVGPVVLPCATGDNAFPASSSEVPTTAVLTVTSCTASAVVASATSSNTVLAVAASTASGSTVAPTMDTQAASFGPGGKFSFNLPLIAAANFDAYPASSCCSTYWNTVSVDHGAYHAFCSRRIYSNLTRPTFRFVPYVHPHATNVNATPANLAAGPAVQSRDTHSDAGPASSSATPPSPEHQSKNLQEGSASEQPSDSKSEEDVSHVGQNGSATIIRDRTGNVTLGEFSETFQQFIFVSVDMIYIVYLELFGRNPADASVDTLQLNQQLRTAEEFEIWEHGLNILQDYCFLIRSGPTYQQMRQTLRRRLRSAKEEKAGVVPAPVLYFSLVTIGCVHARRLADSTREKQFFSTILIHMFRTATGRDLRFRYVITEDGPKSFPGTEYCRFAQGWLMRICKYIVKDNRMKDLLDIADDYYEEYKKAGRDKGNSGTAFDPNGSIARGMLQSCDPVIDLVLGLRGKDLLELYVFLPCMTVGMLDESEHKYLQQASRYALARLERDI
ncbi:hypothetical protein GGI13_004968 [Coemansia sp. RSA 455]|nr:hypothetical protein GGI14_005650 [Coemansia sp. S680]KAJ2058316.1 hypothetical protein GGH13_007150 [Coemansia sp. S155-1]KAJ2247632.1 hypothetical protein GGI13_004968 [Coemansia sp. RSA 455]KAJ2428049.1 hypothetical protein GGF41_001488 [Coemansia sp. RSA 2531]KAJ2458800.1 hypothetical protein GGI03_005720 [Coemansia sp. RSA 2337]